MTTQRYGYQLTESGNVRRSWKPAKSVDRKMRLLVFGRDDYTCLHCGYRPEAFLIDYFLQGVHRSPGVLSLDHIVPYRDHGPFTEDNLQTLCLPCNQRKWVN